MYKSLTKKFANQNLDYTKTLATDFSYLIVILGILLIGTYLQVQKVETTSPNQ